MTNSKLLYSMNPLIGKSAYQSNLEQPVIEQPTTRSTMARLLQLTNQDREAGIEAQRAFQTLQNDPGSIYCNPYTKATNPAVSALQSYGIDTTQEDWYDNYGYLRNYYVQSANSTTPKAPTKKSSLEENVAYQYYQYGLAQDNTNKAKQESAALKEFLSYWANRKDKNLSDEQIMDMVNWKDYPTLQKMKDTARDKPLELNEAVDMATDDWMYGVLWGARNNGGTGNIWKDMANSYLQYGNTWQENKEIADRLTFGNENYAPYTVGSTADDVCAYYGVDRIDDAFLNSHTPNMKDQTEVNMWNKARDAVDFTTDAKKELEEANAWLDKKLSTAKTEADAKRVLDSFDKKLSKDWKHLKQMDDSLRKIDNLIPTSEAIDYSHNDIVKRISDQVGINANKLTTDQTTAKYGVPTETDQTTEVANVGVQNVSDALYALDDQLNDSEKNVFTNTNGSFFGKYGYSMSMLDPVKVAKQNEQQVTSKYATNVVNLGIQMAQNQAAQERLDLLNSRNAEITNRLDAIRDAYRAGTGEFGFLYDIEDGEYVKVNDSYLPNSRYAQALVDLYNAATGYDVEYGDISDITQQAKSFYDYIVNYNPTYEEDEEVPFLLTGFAKEKQSLETTIEQTKDAQAAYERQQEAWDNKIKLFYSMGLDTTGLRTAQVVADIIPYFSEYQATEWLPYGYFDMAAKEIGDNATYDQVIQKTAGDVEQAKENVETAKFIMEYLTDYNIQIPTQYQQNLTRFLEANERVLKDYDYYTLRGEEDFSKMAQEGCEREEKEKKKGRLAFDETDANEEIKFGLDKSEFYNIMTDEEKDTFYYLYAKGGFDAAMDYYLHLTDSTYGVLHTRNSEEIEKNAAEEVNSGWLSGIWANAKAILSGPLEALSSFGYDLERIISGKEFNPYNSSRRYSIYSNTVNAETTQAIKEDLGKKNEDGSVESTIWSDILGGLYEIGYMRSRSTVNGLLTGGFTNEIAYSIIKEILGAIPMGLSAADTAIADAKKKGAQDWQAYALGGITLVAETISEGLTYGNIQEALHGTKEEVARNVLDLLNNWLTSSGIEEMTGETLTEIAEQLANKMILGSESDHEELVKSYLEQLGLDPNDPLARQQAEELAAKDEIGSILHTALISYLSPSMDVISGTISDKVRDLQAIRAETKRLQKQGYNVSMSDIRKEYKAWKEMVRNGEISTAQPETQEEQTAQEETAPAAEKVASEATSATTAVQERTASEADLEFLRQLDLLESVQGSDTATQTDAIGALFGGEENTAENDISRAAAANMTNIFRTMGDAVTELWSLMSGAADEQERQTVKDAMKIAALSKNSTTAQMIASEVFKTAKSISEQIGMLAQTANEDMQNEAVQQEIGKNTREFRIAEKEAEIIKTQPMEQSEKAEADLAKATEAVNQAETALETATDVKEAKLDAAQAADQQAIQNPTDDNVKMQKDAATDLEGAVVAEQQAQDHLEKTQQANAEAETKAEEVKQKELTDRRAQAEQMVAEEDQKRAEMAAQKEAEAQAIAEQQAQAKAEEDERTGKAWEDQRDAIIEDILNSEHLEGTERDDRRANLQEMAENIKLNKINMDGLMNNTEGFLAVAAIGRKLGLGIQIVDDMPGAARGEYANGVVYLNGNLIKQGKMTVGQALVEATLHEITHSMESTNNYQTYRKTVLEALFGDDWENSAEYKAAIEQKQADYKQLVNQDLTAEGAEKEIIADFARTRLNNKDVINRLMDAGLGGKIRNTLHNMNQAIKNLRLTGEEKRTAEYLRRAERAFQKAMNEVAKQQTHPEGGQFSVAQIAQSTGMVFNPTTLELYDQNGNVVDGVSNKVTTEMIASSPVGMLIDSGLTGEQNTKAKDMMAGLMNMVARYKDSNLIWEIGATTLSSTFSALKSNSDPQYKTTVDFGTVCAKTQAIVDVMSKVMTDKIDPSTGMLKEGAQRGLTRDDIMKVYDVVNKAGLSVPCPVCYVFSRWMGVPSLLGQMSQYQADYVVTEKDADGNILRDKNGDFIINKEATQKIATKYIKDAEKKYGDAKAINNTKTKIQNKLAVLEQNRMDLEAQKRDKSLTKEQQKDLAAKVKDILKQMTDLDKQLGEVSAYNWITQALCKKDKSGKFVVDDKFRMTPDEILFDLNRTGEFAGYEKNWTYRNTRGAGMGKAIMPYSGETIGDILYGVKNGGRQNTIKNPWLNMDNKAAARQLKSAKERAAKQNLVGGQRLQSTSDFRPEWGLDYIMSFLELQAAGSKVQMYTKVAEAVDFFASVGADVNLSIMGEGKGWHEDENGNKVLDFSSVTGMDYKTATDLKNKYNNVQMILVGMNDTHIRLAMADGNIDFIIPWHSSGNSKDVLAGLLKSLNQKLDSSVDYTTTQTDMVKGTVKKYKDENGKTVEYTVPGKQTAEEKALWDARVKLLTKGGNALDLKERTMLLSNTYTKDLYRRFTEKGVDNDCYGIKLTKDQAEQIFPYEYWDTSLTKDQADRNGKRFVEYCESMGIVPRFSQFKDDPGYWKLLIDRPMYNNDGTYHQQQIIDVTNARIGDLNEEGKLTDSDLPMQAQAKYAPKDPRNENYEQYTEAEQKAVDAAKAALDVQYEDGTAGQYSVYGNDTTLADMEQMLAQEDADYRSAVERGDMESAQQMVDEKAEEAGYTMKVYHGTPNSGRFNVFDAEKLSNSKLASQIGQGFYFTNSKEGAEEYTKNHDVYGSVTPGKNPYLFEGYLKLQSPLDITESSHNLTLDEIRNIIADGNNQWFFDSGLAHDYVNEIVDGRKYTRDEISKMSREEKIEFAAKALYEQGDKYGKQGDLLEAMKKYTDYDGVRWDMGNGIEQYAVFDPSQFKDSAPVTYDDQGNVIPLSERFNSQNNDIRYSSKGETTLADLEHALGFEYMKSFEEQIDDFMNPDVDNKETFSMDSLLVGKAPKVFTDIGLPNLPVTINQEHVGYAIKGDYPNENRREGHTFSPDEFKKLPDKIAHPIAIAYDPTSTKEVIVYVEMENTTGDQVIVPLRIGGIGSIGNQRINALKIDSIYARENGLEMLESAIRNNSEDNATLFYIDKEKASASGLGYDTKTIVRGLDSGLIHTVTDPASSVKIDVPDQLSSMQFKRWFNGSKVVNDDGTPMVVYHGTSEDFTAFDMSKGRSTMDIQGAFFSPWEEDSAGYGDKVGAYYLSIKNPASEKEAYKVLNMFKGQNEAGKKAREYLISKGYDGVINGVDGQPEEFIAFYPEQIKSATDNVGTYDRNNPDYRYSTGGENTSADDEQLLVNSGIITQEELDAFRGNITGQPTMEGGSAQRQFGSQTAQTSDALHDEVKDYLYTHSDYTPDTNQAQIDRAVDWVKKQANADDPDGYRAAVEEVSRPDFDYRSADGQAKMLTVMGMAALKGDTATEMRLADAYNQQGTDLGRQLQARKLFRMMTPIGRRMILQQEVARINQEYKNANKDTQVELSELTLKAAEMAETEEDFQKVQRAAEKELAEQMPANWKEKLRTWRMLSMLANPRTHIRNIIGNAIFKPVVGLKNAIGAGLESQFVKEGGERTKATKYTEDAKAFAAQDVQSMKDTLTGEAKYSPESRIEQEKKAFGQGNGLLSRTVGKSVQALADFNSDMLEKEDWIFLNKHYQNALASYMTANGLTSADMTGETLQKARTYAVLEAQKATYRDANAVSSWLNSASREGGVKGFLVDAVLPFKKTPANILRRGIEYSPVGLIKSLATAKKSVDLYAAWEANGMKGKMPKGARSLTQALDDIASGLTGTAISALGALAYALGAVKLGFGGDDDDELDKERGSQEYSIELFGHSFTVDWAAPVCMPFFTGAALYKSLVEDGNADFGAVVDSMMKITEPVFNLSMLDGVNSLLTSIKYSQSNLPIGDLAQKIGANYVGSFVPSISGAVARTIDTTRRKNYVPSGATMSVWQSMLEQAQNKIPYLSMKNIPYRDVWGEAEESGRVEAFLENFVLPGYINQMSESKLNDELQRLYDMGEEGMIPKAAGKTVGGEKLDAEQYDRYVVTRGQTAKKYLEELIERPEYIALTDNNPEAQAQLMKDIWEYANAVARYDLFPNYKMDSWIASAYASGNVVDAVLNREEQKAQNAYVKQSNNDLFTAIDAQDADTIAMCVEGLKQAGKDDKSIRTTVMNHYRDLYKQAYLADDEPTMEAIRYGLEYLDLDDYSIDDDVFDKWEAAVDAEQED